MEISKVDLWKLPLLTNIKTNVRLKKIYLNLFMKIKINFLFMIAPKMELFFYKSNEF